MAKLESGHRKAPAHMCAGEPIFSQAEAAKMLNVSRRSVQSARIVREHGTPELVAAGGDPVYILRQLLIDNRMARRKLTHLEIFALTIKAWNHFRMRQKISSLTWRPHGKTPEPFPKAE
ncbi:MAG TPA: hypothetical protein VG125_11195 [Pirellulales bacterium]|nr:hypothetical protein [Pirellulales bacterium]